MKLRTIIATALTVVALTAATILPAKAATVSLEGVYGSDSQGETTSETAILDTAAYGSLASKLNYYFRYRAAINIEDENTVNDFTLVNLSYPIKLGGEGKLGTLGILSSTGLPSGGEADFRAGVEYFVKAKKGPANGLVLYVATTRNFSEDPNTDLFAKVTYSPSGDGVQPYARIESLTNIGDEEFNFGLARLRAGVTWKGIRIGVADDISNIGTGDEVNHTLGGFIGKDF